MDIDLQVVVSRRIRQTLQAKGWTQNDLVYKVQQAGMGRVDNLDKSTISRSLAGNRKWQLNELPALALALGIPLTDLIIDPDVWANENAKRLILKWGKKVQDAEDYGEQHMQALEEAGDIFDELRGFLRYEPDARTAVMHAMIHRAQQSGKITTEAGVRRAWQYQLYRLTEDPEYAVGIEDLLPVDDEGKPKPPARFRRPE